MQPIIIIVIIIIKLLTHGALEAVEEQPALDLRRGRGGDLGARGAGPGGGLPASSDRRQGPQG